MKTKQSGSLKTTRYDTHYERIKAKGRKDAEKLAARDLDRSVLAGLREVVERPEKTLARMKAKKPQEV
jgi:hypothetical protein